MVVIMSEKAAFPLLYEDGGFQSSMTLRDYFAAKALQGILTNGGWVSMYVEAACKVGPFEDMSKVAAALSDDAYTFADAMLEARDDA